LPGRFADSLGRLITRQGAEALKGDNDRFTIPLQITGTTENPRPSLDEGRIQNLVAEYLRSRAQDEGRDAVRGLLNRLRDN
ncbi:MAG: hypothetical protein WDZ53_02955, partial [Balneolales bacterium]